MAKLYPPTIAGTLPSFYETTEENGITKIVIPFSMNKTVGVKQITKFSLRIKTTNTDILYGVLESDNWDSKDLASPQVEFSVPEEVLRRFVIGQFYKVQLAYIDNDGVTGYYSSIGIIKFTAKPKVEISSFNHLITNQNRTEYIGEYRNELDPSEKVYQYRFCLYDIKNNLLESSDWKIHNSYEDTSLTSSIDKYILRFAFDKNKTYQIQYQVITNNNLQVNSLKYMVMDAESIKPDLKAQLVANLDYDNACIGLRLIGEKMPNGNEYAATGMFMLSRCSSLDNYATWLPISQFRMTGQLPSTFVFKDYTIVQGARYIYSLQQFNDNSIYSSRILTDEIEAQFEDAYLFDGERQLRIRFNPKVASFKTVVQESKKNTIGAKYPYIIRSGSIEYKEFPINGLISYKMDENEFFVSKEKELFIQNHEDTFNITDKNVLAERLFKLEVLNWLNNGSPKLFKSPQEGNYIVRLMNVSLQPIDTVSRMLHNFSCQATEIADYTPDNLIKYKLLNSEEDFSPSMRWETIILSDYSQQLKKEGKSIYDIDLLGGHKAYHIKFTDTPVETMFSFFDSNDTKRTVMIGVTGAYEVYLDEPIYNLKLVPKRESVQNRQGLMQGTFTFGRLSSTSNTFDTITDLTTKEIPVIQVFGPSDNILEYYQNLRRQVVRVLYTKFSKIDVQEVYSNLFGEQIIDKNGEKIYLNGVVINLNSKTIYDLQTIDNNQQIVHEYYRYFTKKEYVDSLKYYYKAMFDSDFDPDYDWSNIDERFDKIDEYNFWIIVNKEYNFYNEYLNEIAFIQRLIEDYFLLYGIRYDSGYSWLDNEIYNEDGEYVQQYIDWLTIKQKETNVPTNGQFYSFTHFSTIMPGLDFNIFNRDETTQLSVVILDQYTIYRDLVDNKFYRLDDNQLIENKWIAKQSGSNTYNIEYNDLNPYTIYHKKAYDEQGRLQEAYYKFDGVKLINLSTDLSDPNKGYSTKIYYDDVELDVMDKNTIVIQETKLPKKISIGSGVCAEFGIQVKLIEYQVETLCPTEKLQYELAEMAYLQEALNFRPLKKEEQEVMPVDGIYFIWQKGSFYNLSSADIVEYRRRKEQVYTPTYEVISKQTIADSYKTMLEKEAAFIEKLNYYLEAYLEDLLQ